MAERDEPKALLLSLHDSIAKVLVAANRQELEHTLVTDRWNVLDMIGHINSWGLLFTAEARYMAQHPGQPFPYQIVTKSNFDDENEALVVRRRGWSPEQHRAENEQLSREIGQLTDWLGSDETDPPVPLPWHDKPMNIQALLRYHYQHGIDHLQEVLLRLA
jgi:hypothetical protein